MDGEDDVMRGALRGLRRDSLRAQRRRDPALMVSIGLAEPHEEPDGDEDSDDSASLAPPSREANVNKPSERSWVDDVEKRDPEEERRRTDRQVRALGRAYR